MSLSAISCKQSSAYSHARGFTLLEVLAVLFIIGIIVSFASLSVNQSSSRVVEDEARRLHGLLRMASDEAVLKGQELALQFNSQSYAFVQLKEDKWLPVDQDRLLREREVPEGIELQLTLEGVAMSLEENEQPPRIFLLSSGELTPFELTLVAPESDKYLLRGDLVGNLELKKIDEDA